MYSPRDRTALSMIKGRGKARVMERESARWSLLGHGLDLAPEPMVLTTVLHSLIPNRNNTEKPDLVLGEREAKP